jgi:hypothetical protein
MINRPSTTTSFPSHDLSEFERLWHRTTITELHPSLPQRAGRAFAELVRIHSLGLEAGHLASRIPHPIYNPNWCRVLDRPGAQANVNTLARTFLSMANGVPPL